MVGLSVGGKLLALNVSPMSWFRRGGRSRFAPCPEGICRFGDSEARSSSTWGLPPKHGTEGVTMSSLYDENDDDDVPAVKRFCSAPDRVLVTGSPSCETPSVDAVKFSSSSP
ncbi:unnamed protein product [Heligmosomoides polygyrus]|uniref:Uncharacterized protein n=1 Tax=Heligmosomoides polygyrus TaxID=6339 RepID=A0A183FEE1_HELPZ|nr:unnamed protein product [Heligmosomoides polygyrus]